MSELRAVLTNAPFRQFARKACRDQSRRHVRVVRTTLGARARDFFYDVTKGTRSADRLLRATEMAVSDPVRDLSVGLFLSGMFELC